MDKLTSIKIKYSDGTYLDEVPIGVLAQNVGYDNSHNLIQVLGSVDVESNGTIQQQINRLFNEKLNTSDLSSYVNGKITTDVSIWLANNVIIPTGGTVVVDQSLSISGAAADAAKVGAVKEDLNITEEFHNHIVPIPCDDSTSPVDSGGVFEKLEKHGKLIYANGIPSVDFNRLCIYGTFAYSSTVPSYSNRPTWYGNALTKFVIGHKYKFDYKLISGTITQGEVTNHIYFDLRTQSGLSYLTGGGLPHVWKCTFQPEMVAFVLPAYIYTNAVIYMSVVDLTDAQADDLLLGRVEALEMETAKLYNGIDYDVSNIGTISRPTGWEMGYYPKNGNTWSTSKRFMCTVRGNEIPLTDIVKVVLVPPDGYAISANAKDANGTYTTYGNANTTEHPENANKQVEFDATNYVSCILLVGRFTDASAATKAASSDYCSTIKVYLYANAISELDDRIDALEADDLPSYWQTYISAKAQALAQADAPPIGAGTRFMFITDTHMMAASGEANNAGYSPYLMRYLHDYANIGLAFFGGDAITSRYATQADAVKDLIDFRKKFSPIWDWMYSVWGNHDYGAIDSAISPLGKPVIYNILTRDKEMRYESVNPTYGSYILDDKVEKTRFICLNINEGNNLTQQSAFFCDAMLNTPSGWTIVFITHFSLNKQSDDSVIIHAKLTNANSIIPAIEAYNAREVYGAFDFTNASAEVACVIGGHCHFDGMVKTAGGVPVISTTCDKFYTDDENRATTALGTTSEQAFDVVTINTTEKTIAFTRIGYGSDRSYTYGS